MPGAGKNLLRNSDFMLFDSFSKRKTYFVAGLDGSNYHHHISRILRANIRDGRVFVGFRLNTIFEYVESTSIYCICVFMKRDDFPTILWLASSGNLENLTLGVSLRNFVYDIW
jgi:hypothetical protein